MLLIFAIFFSCSLLIFIIFFQISRRLGGCNDIWSQEICDEEVLFGYCEWDKSAIENCAYTCQRCGQFQFRHL
jgi:hypothetical protein